MAKKSLPGSQSTEKLTSRDDRQSTKRLSIDLSAEEHKAFKQEALDAGMSMNDYFVRLWKKSR